MEERKTSFDLERREENQTVLANYMLKKFECGSDFFGNGCGDHAGGEQQNRGMQGRARMWLLHTGKEQWHKNTKG